MNKRFLSLAAFGAASALFAQQSILLEPLQVTSSPLHNDERTAPDAVEIYTSEDIADARVQTLYEFLNQHTSVVTSPGYGNPFMQKIDMRGYGIGDGYQNVVVTLNGRRMNNVDMVPQLLGSIPPGTIERIEIFKGSGIVSGGDGANAGVINIITKQGGQTSLTLYGGSDSTRSGSFYGSKSGEIYTVTLSGDTYNSAGTRKVDAAGNTDEKQLRNGRIDLSLFPIEALELHGGVHAVTTQTIYGGFLTQAEYEADPSQPGLTNWGATEQAYRSRVFSLGGAYEISDAWSLTADFNREEKKSHYVTYGSVAKYDYDTLNLSTSFEKGGFKMSAGIDWFDGSRSGVARISKENRAAYVLSQYRFDRQSLKAGYRYEKVTYDNGTDLDKSHDLHGFELGYNLLLGSEASLFANYTRSYQSADLDRMFSYTTGAFTGYVDPAKAHTFNIGYSRIGRANKLKLSLFYSDLKNEIYYYADPTWVASRNTNIDRSHKYGLELLDTWHIGSRWSVTANYSYVRALIDEEVENGEDYSGNTLPGVSRHNIKAGVSYLLGDATTVGVMQRYRSKAYAANDFGNSFSQKQDAFESTDLSLTHAGENYEWFVKINNLFDRSNGIWIKDNSIYPSEFTRTFTVGLTLKY